MLFGPITNMTFYPTSTVPRTTAQQTKCADSKESMFKPTRRRAAVVFTLESRNCSKFLTHRVVNSSDEIGVPHDGLGGPPNLDVSDGVVAPPRDELVDVEDESDDDLGGNSIGFFRPPKDGR